MGMLGGLEGPSAGGPASSLPTRPEDRPQPSPPKPGPKTVSGGQRALKELLGCIWVAPGLESQVRAPGVVVCGPCALES